MADDHFSSLPPELQERIKKLPLMNGRSKVAEIAAEAAKGGDNSALKAEVEKLTKERDDAQKATEAITAGYEAFKAQADKDLSDLRAAVETAKTDLAAAQTALETAKAELPKKVEAGVSQGVKEGLAACAVPAAQLPAPAQTAEQLPQNRQELEKAMDAIKAEDAEKTAQARLELLRRYNAAQASK